jgi:hypothetical protein
VETPQPNNNLPPAFNAESFERQTLTDWAANTRPELIERAWSTGIDDHGGSWLGVRHPDFPTMCFGFYFEADGVASRFIIEPFRLVPDGVWRGVTTGLTGVGVQLTRRLLREVPFGELERAAREFARQQVEMGLRRAGEVVTFLDVAGGVIGQQPLEEGGGPGGTLETAWRRRLNDLNEAPATRSVRGGRPPLYTDSAYALMAYRYAMAIIHGQNPIDAVAKDFYVSHSQARNLISTARKKGMLTATVPGRAGGQLTPSAAELLEECNAPLMDPNEGDQK